MKPSRDGGDVFFINGSLAQKGQDNRVGKAAQAWFWQDELGTAGERFQERGGLSKEEREKAEWSEAATVSQVQGRRRG